jgi:hypothetical protein
MRTGISLAFIALGAIFAFAVKGSPSFLNIHTAGWVIMIIGLIGLLLSRRVYTWLGGRRRTLVRRTYPGGRVEQVQAPSYAAGDPVTRPFEDNFASRPALIEDQDGNLIEDPADPRYRSVQTQHGTEVVEDLYEQP